MTNNAFAYVVFPDVGKGALIVGGAGGRGVVYRNGQPIGTAKLEQISAGPQIEGESYSELVVFQNEDAFNRFQKGDLQWGAQASAIAVKAGAGSATDFDRGVAVYVLPKGGLGAGASIAGQKLTFMPDTGGEGT
jgi:lipid-binding SYLF domain-containing protein